MRSRCLIFSHLVESWNKLVMKRLLKWSAVDWAKPIQTSISQVSKRKLNHKLRSLIEIQMHDSNSLANVYLDVLSLEGPRRNQTGSK